MRGSELRSLPLTPPGIAEWEDLLVRVELGPRALRVAIDVAPNDALTSSLDAEGWSVVDHLRHLARRELEAGEWLVAMREGTSLVAGARAQPAPGPEPVPQSESPAEAESFGLADPVGASLRLYTERRARNFAVVQRRGVDVWEWRAEHPEVGFVSAYRLFCHLAAHDGRHLARIRAALREVG